MARLLRICTRAGSRLADKLSRSRCFREARQVCGAHMQLRARIAGGRQSHSVTIRVAARLHGNSTAARPYFPLRQRFVKIVFMGSDTCGSQKRKRAVSMHAHGTVRCRGRREWPSITVCRRSGYPAEIPHCGDLAIGLEAGSARLAQKFIANC